MTGVALINPVTGLVGSDPQGRLAKLWQGNGLQSGLEVAAL